MARSPVSYLMFSLLAVAAFLPCHAQQGTTGRQEGFEEIVVYDTTDADAVQFQCEPLDDTSQFNPRCNLNPSACMSWQCSGSASLTYCDSEFFVPGRTSDVYQLFNCTDENIAICDSECSCETGTYVGSGSDLVFESDGGNCTILDVEDGSLAPYPTEAPTMGENATTMAPSPTTTAVPSAAEATTPPGGFFPTKAPSTAVPSMETTPVPTPVAASPSMKMFSICWISVTALLMLN